MQNRQGLVTIHQQGSLELKSNASKLPSAPHRNWPSFTNYGAWDKTKAQRLNIDKIEDIHKQPLLNIAFTCGFRNNTHEVLKDMVQRHVSRNIQASDQPTINHFEKILSQHQSHSAQKSKQPVSYLKYKRNNQEMAKINSYLSPTKSPKPFKKKACFSSSFHVSQIAKNPPKELKDLKKRLKSLPSVSSSQRKSIPVAQNSIQDRIEIGQDVKDYSEELRELVQIFRKEQINNQREEMREAIQSQKKDILFRFQYKLNVERDTFRRNVKSYMRCIIDYRNETKREQVRANGIKRFKRVSMLQKVKRLLQEQAEAQARQIAQTI